MGSKRIPGSTRVLVTLTRFVHWLLLCVEPGQEHHRDRLPATQPGPWPSVQSRDHRYPLDASKLAWARLAQSTKIALLAGSGFEFNETTRSWVKPVPNRPNQYYEWSPSRPDEHPYHSGVTIRID